ncbi:MAG: disulfide bond formation protein B [Pseudomonadota bacterium]
MTRTYLIGAAALGSLALLLGAWGFQALGYAPCQMCIWQRYPHGAAAGIGLIALLVPLTILPLLGALAALTTGGIGVFHTGVERGWWEGPSSCSAGDIGNLSTEDLMAQIMSAPLVRCDEVAWELLGLSMASWNAVLSFGLAGVWFVAYMLRTP